MKIVITGSRGLIGSSVVPRLETDGHEVIRLLRGRVKSGGNSLHWDPQTLNLDKSVIPENTDVLIHLAGENIVGRWTRHKKAEIRNSRVITTDLLSGIVSNMEKPPSAFIVASAIGLYGNRGDEKLTEASEPGTGYLAEVGKAWEGAANPARLKGIRTVHLRFGLVLSARGGALKKIIPAFKLGIAGPLGNGRQYMSWIALDDAVEIIRQAVTDKRYDGPINVVSPNPVTNAQFTETLARFFRRRARLAAPPFALRLAFGDMADEALLASVRAYPRKLEELGFEFKWPDLAPALAHALSGY